MPVPLNRPNKDLSMIVFQFGVAKKLSLASREGVMRAIGREYFVMTTIPYLKNEIGKFPATFV